MLSTEEREVLKKVLDYTIAREAAVPTGKRPLVADPSGLSADDMVVYLRMVECVERERDLRENGTALKVRMVRRGNRSNANDSICGQKFLP